MLEGIYEDRLESSWTHFITTSRNFVEVRWRSLFRSTSLGKRCTSYNASPTSRITVVLKEPFLWWRSNLSGASALRDWKVAIDALTEISGTPLKHRCTVQISFHAISGFSIHEKGAPVSKPPVPLSSWSLRQTVCSTLGGVRVIFQERISWNDDIWKWLAQNRRHFAKIQVPVRGGLSPVKCYLYLLNCSRC
jgi:hypothetical protein